MTAPRVVVVTLWSGARVVRRLAPSDPDPSAADLDALAVAWTPRNGGVKPVVRVLSTAAPFGRRLGAAGSVPRR